MSGGVTLLDISILIEAYVRGIPNKNFSEEMLSSTNRLLNAKMIEIDNTARSPELPGGIVISTARGTCLCEAIRALPLPISTWKMPEVLESKIGFDQTPLGR